MKIIAIRNRGELPGTYLQHVRVVVTNGNGRYVGEDIQHGVAVGVKDVVSDGLVVVGEECHRGHGLNRVLK